MEEEFFLNRVLYAFSGSGSFYTGFSTRIPSKKSSGFFSSLVASVCADFLPLGIFMGFSSYYCSATYCLVLLLALLLIFLLLLLIMLFFFWFFRTDGISSIFYDDCFESWEFLDFKLSLLISWLCSYYSLCIELNTCNGRDAR
jgi:hypothetical protein